MEVTKTPSLELITKKAQDVIKNGHLKQDTKNMMTFGLIVSLLSATHLLAYNSGIQTGVIMTAITVNIADAVSEQSTSSARPGFLKPPTDAEINLMDFRN